MKKRLLLAACLLPAFGFAQKIDSSYNNWYYEGRMDLYNQLNNQPADILFLGNSITERGEWAELLPGRKIANRGIGGDNTFGVLARLDGVIKQQPGRIFLLIGINDIGRSAPTEVILSNYRQIVAKLTAGLPRTKLIIQSVLPMNDGKLAYDYLKGKAAKVKALNEGIVLIAKEFKLTYLNLHELFADEKGELKAEYTKDGIHLEPAAYVDWVNWLKKRKQL
ncbi:GDSL family lipase [Chitinophaga sp. SYP-B3965]|uniref:GDSL-type esterase/lipase family protein n=1 Tax=Chitinophaga sp. SYP-B3965 TaxID=2663120 RepID=UPI00129981B0|nr:GDSL-type esterase/lipase family protein [Chitinophaga sp. SYP-B3965]MRG46098.1 GDSL family lipase [Chitinophaga sp. SYP-B3965]